MAFDGAGNLYVADLTVNMVFRFTPAGAKTTFASSGLNGPTGLAFDTSGNLYVSSVFGGTISRFTPDGSPSLFATGLKSPESLAFDASGNLFVADAGNSNIVRITPGGIKSIYASGFISPFGLAFDSAGNLFVTDLNDPSIFLITPSGAKSTFVRGQSASGFLAFEPALHHLLNISTRSLVGAGESALIGGFILGGTGQVNGAVVARAIGPSLTAFGISNAFRDPVLELRNASGVIVASNDDWRSGQQTQIIQSIGLAPSNDLESAILATLPSGNYTAVVRGLNDTTGIGLVEVYNLQ